MFKLDDDVIRKLDDVIRLWSRDVAMRLAEMSLFDRALLFMRCALSAQKRVSGEKKVIEFF